MKEGSQAFFFFKLNTYFEVCQFLHTWNLEVFDL